MTRRPAAAKPKARPDWPAAETAMRAIETLIPYVRNARTHSEAQIEQIARSIASFGFTNPILVDENSNIIAGHGRVLAAKKLGYPEVPVVVARGWTEAQRRAYVLADNQLALNAGWDPALLALELKDLQGFGFDISLIGFSDAEIKEFFPEQQDAEDAAADEDAPEPPERPVTRRGDIWLLGEQRIMCGDSVSRDDVAALLAGCKPHLMVTDPPYGVEYNPMWRHDAGVNNSKRTGAVRNDDQADWREAWALFPGEVAYVWHAAVRSKWVIDSLLATRFEIRSEIIWSKKSMVIGRGNYHWKHEPAIYAVRKGGKGHWQGARDQTTVWEINSRKQSDEDAVTIHGTQKPVECMRRPMINNSEEGDHVYEPFSGSGTSLIAAQITKRKCRAMEIDPPYVDVAVLRWQQFTGQEAVLLGRPDATYAKVKQEREAEESDGC